MVQQKKKKAPRAAAGTPREHLKALIAERTEDVGDGSLQVLMAIATVTDRVTVNTSDEPPFKPENLLELTFADVGLSDDLVAVFKANLTIILPEIADDIAQIPDNAGLPIADVLEFVRLSLLRI